MLRINSSDCPEDVLRLPDSFPSGNVDEAEIYCADEGYYVIEPTGNKYYIVRAHTNCPTALFYNSEAQYDDDVELGIYHCTRGEDRYIRFNNVSHPYTVFELDTIFDMYCDGLDIDRQSMPRKIVDYIITSQSYISCASAALQCIRECTHKKTKWLN